MDQNNENPQHFYDGVFLQTKVAARVIYNNKINARFSVKAGLTGNYYYSNFLDSVNISNTGFVTLRDYDGHSGLIQGFTQGKYKVTRFMSIVAGLYIFYRHEVPIEEYAVAAFWILCLGIFYIASRAMMKDYFT